jgi:hypothetical protein
MARADSERDAALADLSRSAAFSTVLPEDGSVDPTAFHMALSAVGMHDDVGFVKELARIGAAEGFEVVVRTDAVSRLDGFLTDEERRSVVAIGAQSPDIWMEDPGEIHADGSISYATLADAQDDQAFLSSAILRDRERRLAGEDVDTQFHKHGRVEMRRKQRGFAELALSLGREVREALSYIEGGNLLAGMRANGEAFALVGRDSLAVTRAALERDLDRPVEDDELLAIVAKDLGVAPNEVHPVEQPGDFHLDMYMSVVGEGEVLLNDAREAARLQAQWLHEDLEALRPAPLPESATAQERTRHQQAMDRYEAKAQSVAQSIPLLEADAARSAKFEALVQRDLEAAGMTVHRVAGVFKNPRGHRLGDQLRLQAMNFINAEKGTAPDGKRFMVLLGGDPRAERAFETKLRTELPHLAERLHFMDASLTGPSLEMDGGINCRVKPDGTVVAGA